MTIIRASDLHAEILKEEKVVSLKRNESEESLEQQKEKHCRAVCRFCAGVPEYYQEVEKKHGGWYHGTIECLASKIRSMG